ncbi:MAG: helix-turn-helix transcriptional regulator [Caulobacteraceae bacterium]
MRRADRLFQIIQILRRGRGPHTADRIAEELETSKRTVYRDIAALLGQRVPIRGEAGVGYVLEDGFDLPPLALTPDEIEAAVLGAQWVAVHGDPVLARAAQDLRAKLMASVPERLRPLLLDPAVGASPYRQPIADPLDLAQVRAAIHAGRKLRLRYSDVEGVVTERVVWPIAIGYLDYARMLVAWCELRRDFRHFRADRVQEAAFLEDRFPERSAVLRARWRRSLELRPIRRAQDS